MDGSYGDQRYFIDGTLVCSHQMACPPSLVMSGCISPCESMRMSSKSRLHVGWFSKMDANETHTENERGVWNERGVGMQTCDM